MAQAHAQSHDGHHDHDAHSPKHYIKIWGILVLLLAASIIGPEIAKFMDAGIGRTLLVLITAFGIAFVKAWLVIKHFMHLTVEKPIVWYILITCLVFLVLFFAGVAPDVKNHEGTNWENVAAKAEIERSLANADGEMSRVKRTVSHATTEDMIEKRKAPKAAEAAAPPPEPATAEKKFSDLTTDAAKKSWLMKRGEKLYVDAACVTCHRSNGAGHGPFPTLVGSAVLADCAKTNRVLTSGMAEGPVEIDGRTFNHPPAQGLDGTGLAAVGTYIRNSWGNEFGICAP